MRRPLMVQTQRVAAPLGGDTIPHAGEHPLEVLARLIEIAVHRPHHGCGFSEVLQADQPRGQPGHSASLVVTDDPASSQMPLRTYSRA